MASRNDLRTVLRTFEEGLTTYYQPPSELDIKYPCIIYKTGGYDTKRADNTLYLIKKKYLLTVITQDVDLTESIGLKIMSTLNGKWVRSFSTDYLHHAIYEIYF